MKICVIGDYDSICGFGALGMSLMEANSGSEAEKCINSAAESDFAVIFITENVAKEIKVVLDEYKTKKIPAIIPIPSISGTYGVGYEEQRSAVMRAVGSAEMIFGENE